MLNDEQAKQELINDSFQAALEQLEQINPAAKSKLFEKISDVTKGIQKISFQELSELKSGFQPGKVESLQKLHEAVDNLIKDISRG